MQHLHAAAAAAGRHAPGTPPSKRLRSGPRSRMLLYLTGHGGDEFLKFHDQVGGGGWAHLVFHLWGSGTRWDGVSCRPFYGRAAATER